MSLKIVVAVLALACAAQALSASDIFDKIKNTLDNTGDQVKKVEEKIKNAVEAANEKVQEVAGQAAEKWQSAVDAVVEEATAAGVSVSECVDNEALNQTIDALKTDAERCVADEEEQMLVAFDSVKQVAEEVQALYIEAKSALELCEAKSLLGRPACVAGTLAAELKKAGIAAKEIANVASAFSYMTGVAVRDVGVCVAAAVNANSAQATETVQATVRCISEKINSA